MQIWLNGAFVDRDAARVSVFDAGFQHAVGLFETLLARNGRIFRPDQHMERLRDSARELALSTSLRPGPLADAAQMVVEKNGMDAARVRMTITGGDLNMLQAKGETPQDPTILIVAQPPTPYPDPFFTEGVRGIAAQGRLNPLDAHEGHKTMNYWRRIQALQEAALRGGGEAIWFTVSNHIAGGSVSNIFLVKDGALLTPYARGEEAHGALPAPVLPGITRRVIIECAEAEGITVERRMLDIDDLLSADEVFFTNSSWGVLPMTAMEREVIGDGTPGPVTRTLREQWVTTVDAETAAPA